MKAFVKFVALFTVFSLCEGQLATWENDYYKISKSKNSPTGSTSSFYCELLDSNAITACQVMTPTGMTYDVVNGQVLDGNSQPVPGTLNLSQS